MTIFNIGGGGSGGGLTFKEMTSGPYEVKASDWADNQTRVDNYLFYYDTKITSVAIKEGYTAIGNNVFQNATNLASVTLPSTLTSIGSNAFSSTSIENIDLTNVTSIGASAFTNSKLKNIEFFNVSSLPNAVCQNCYELETLTISASVTAIQGNAFRNCGRDSDGLTIEMLGYAPPTITNTTFQSANILKIIVPQGSLSAYRSASNWTTYAQYMEEAR